MKNMKNMSNISNTVNMKNNIANSKDKIVPISLSKDTNYNWNVEGNIRRDSNIVHINEMESMKSGIYRLESSDPSNINTAEYLERVNEICQLQKQYRNTLHKADEETSLQRRKISNLREINQLYTRPYKGMYMGAGTRSIDNKDLESKLQQGLLTNYKMKATQPTRTKTTHRFIDLPDYGNPQRIQHIDPPPIEIGGWNRNGLNTRDIARQVDYRRRCLNVDNEKIVNKIYNK